MIGEVLHPPVDIRSIIPYLESSTSQIGEFTILDKVCVRIPTQRRRELMAIAKRWREEETEGGFNRAPGWDAKAMHSVIKKNFNSLEDFFEKNGWPERGSQMMQKVQYHVKERYGSIEGFVNLYEK